MTWHHIAYFISTIITAAVMGCIAWYYRKQRDIVAEALRKSDALYHLLGDHMTDTVWLMDMNLKTTYTSPSVERRGGFTFQDIEKMPLEKHLTPESLKIASEVFLEEMAKVNVDPFYSFTHRLDLEFYRKDGSTFWSENTFSLIRDGNGMPVSILGEGRDITDRKRVESHLNEQIAEHQRWHNATLGREGRILDLKREVNELLVKDGRPPRYPSAESQDKKEN
jgi:PAS domain S-box-containing protein